MLRGATGHADTEYCTQGKGNLLYKLFHRGGSEAKYYDKLSFYYESDTQYTYKTVSNEKNNVSLLDETLFDKRKTSLSVDKALFNMLESSLFTDETLSDKRKTSLSIGKALSGEHNSTLSLSGLLLEAVRTVSLLLGDMLMRSTSTAIYSVENGMLYVDSPVALGGVQFRIRAPKSSTTIETQSALTGFEQSSLWQNDSTYFFMAYSMSGKEIPAGKTALLRIGGSANLNQVVFSDTKGQNVIGVSSDIPNIAKEEGNQLLKAYPNPFRSELMIPYTIGFSTNTKVELIFTDLLGRTVDHYRTNSSMAGNYQYVWRPSGSIASGLYFCSLSINGKIVQTEKVVLLR